MAPRACFAALLALLAVPVPADAARKGRPDLRQAAPVVIGARTVSPAAAISVVDVIRNSGRRRARPARTRFLLSRDALASADDLVLGERRTPRLRRRRASRRTVALTLPAPLEPGAWRLLACADATGRVRERRERDNCRAALLPLHVPFPPPPPPPPPPPQPVPRLAELPPEPEPEPQPEPEPPSTDPATIAECDLPVAGAGDPASAFTAMFAATRRGWTGGDGTLSAELPGGETVWLFGDSFIGGITAEGGREHSGFGGRNLAVVQDERCLTTHFRGTPDAPTGFELAPGDDWYWGNQPVVHGGDLRVFWTRLHAFGSGPFDFSVASSELATYGPGLERTAMDTSVPTLEDQWWGAAIVDADPWTYVFGIQDAGPWDKRVLLARTPLEDLDGAWEYRRQSGWTEELEDAEPVLAVEGEVSTQLSVIADDEADGWALVSQEILGPEVNVWRSGDLVTWEPRETLATLPEVEGGITYNAVVQPQFTGGDRDLLISYNVNAAHDNPDGLWEDASLYRPRFVRVTPPWRSGTR